VTSSLSGSDLLVTVEYGGGCEVHDWTLCWDGSFAESFPVQAFLTLDHDANNDTCLALLTEQITFDLSELELAWIAGYGPGPGTILVHLDGTTHTFNF
jgi:hypothetical protein